MKFYLYGGLLFIAFSVFLYVNKAADLEIERNGQLVKMQIVKLDAGCTGTKTPHFATFSYEGQEFGKMIPEGFCDEHHIGELFTMKYLQGKSNILFPWETVRTQLISAIGLGLMGVFVVIYYFVKRRA